MMPRLPVVGLPTYGLLVAAGFLAALMLAWRLSPRAGLAAAAVQDVMIWASLWGIVGAKLLLVAVDPGAFLRDPLSLLVQGGVFYGGAIAGAVAGWFRARRLGLAPWVVADVIAPSLALAHVFGRIGCFLAGCCHGSACTAPWAVRYADPLSLPVLSGISPAQGLHPTQLYEAAGSLALVVVLVAVLSRRRFDGQVWWTHVGAYAVLRILVETTRGDARGSVGPLSTSQAIAAAGLVASVVMMGLLARRASEAPAP